MRSWLFAFLFGWFVVWFVFFFSYCFFLFVCLFLLSLQQISPHSSSFNHPGDLHSSSSTPSDKTGKRTIAVAPAKSGHGPSKSLGGMAADTSPVAGRPVSVAFAPSIQRSSFERTNTCPDDLISTPGAWEPPAPANAASGTTKAQDVLRDLPTSDLAMPASAQADFPGATSSHVPIPFTPHHQLSPPQIRSHRSEPQTMSLYHFLATPDSDDESPTRSDASQRHAATLFSSPVPKMSFEELFTPPKASPLSRQVVVVSPFRTASGLKSAFGARKKVDGIIMY